MAAAEQKDVCLIKDNGHGSSATRHFSSSSSDCSDTASSLTSQEFHRLHIEQGIDLDLGTERENVADIFGLSDSLNETYTDRQNTRDDTEHPISSTFWSCDPSIGVTIQVGASGAAAETPETVLDIFHRTLMENGNSLALAVKRAGQWCHWNYLDYYDECIKVAKAFIKLGLEPHHGVCILGFNGPEWHISNMAAIMAGGIPVGLYLTNTAEACCYIADSCKANIIVVDNDAQLKKIMQIRPRLTHLRAVIFYSKVFSNKEEGVIEWNELDGLLKDINLDEKLSQRMSSIAPNKCCTIIYTSGTTGNSKGVMLSHDNMTWMCRRIVQETKATSGKEKIISYLPLSHVASQLLDIYFTMSSGGSCWFAQPDALKGSLLQTLREVHPTVFLGVPRVWDKIAESMQLIARNTTGIKARISQWAKGVGLKGNLSKQLGGSGTPFGWSFANLIFFKKVRRGLGLDKCHFPMTGSAPISQDTLAYFMSVNIPIHELYGMSETTGPTTVTTQDNIRFQSSGRAVDGIELHINNPDEAGNGEVFIRGRHLFMGYIGDPQATSDVITEDGWLKSGDIGYINHEGYLYITGRMKELLIIATGEKIAPVPIESAIKEELPIVSNVMLVGDKKKCLSCLITLKVEFDDVSGYPTNRLNPTALAVCNSYGSQSKTVEDIVSGDHQILRTIQKAIDKVNRRALCPQHKVVKWSILDRDFSIATGELTHTMKLKRRAITLKYADIIESLYTDQL